MIRSGRRGQADPALRRIRPLRAPRTRVLLLQRPGYVEARVALIPRRRTLPARRSILIPPSGLILIIRMLALVDHAKTIRLLDERFLVVVRQQSPKFP